MVQDHDGGPGYWETPELIDSRGYEGSTPEALRDADEILKRILKDVESKRRRKVLRRQLGRASRIQPSIRNVGR